MRLILSALLLSIASFAVSQDTVDVAVDSTHRKIFLSSGITGIQNWTPFITRSQKNTDLVRFVQDDFEIALDSFHVPYDGYMTSRYGMRWNVMHAGVDIALKTGDTVRSAWDGVVRYAMMDRGGYGNLVIVRHRNGLETYYAHLSRVKVQSGQAVKAGEPIGLGGNTGHSFGAHLHFEIRFYDIAIDPEDVVDFRKGAVVGQALTLTPGMLKARMPANVPYEEFESIEFVAGVALPMSGKYESKVPANMRRYHYVKKGDCLEKIASAYRTSVQDLCRLNHIDELKWLFVGQRIRVN